MINFVNMKGVVNSFDPNQSFNVEKALQVEADLVQIQKELSSALDDTRKSTFGAAISDKTKPVRTVEDVLAVLQKYVGAGGGGGGGTGNGAPGEDGLSAYEVAVANGFVGTEAEWLASLVGPQGPQGIQGVQGIQGETGPAGADGADGAANTIYDQALFISGLPPDGVTLYRNVLARSVQLAGNALGSVGFCSVNPTATAVFDLLKNGASVGSVSISTGGVFTFSTTGGLAVSFVAGDRFELVAPSPQDATLQNISITLVLTRL